MATRADLLAVAEGLAASAREQFNNRPTGVGEFRYGPDPRAAADLALAAKTALEAAALAENVTSSDIDHALAQMQDVLAEAGVLDKALELPAAEFLDQAFRAILAWRAEVLKAQGYEIAYDGLRDLCEGLERDFTAGGTDTSTRIAGRIRTALDDATQIVNRSTRGAEDGSDQNES